MDGKLIVCCFLWEDALAKCRNIYHYGQKHVRLLQSMVSRNLTLEHEFVCVTDQPERFETDENIRAVRMDPSTFVPGTRFAKLMLWREDIAGIIGGERIVYMDLDCVVTGNLDPVFDRPEDVVLWRNPNFQGPEKRRARYNTSLMLLTAGARPKLYHGFKKDKHPAMLRKVWGGTDQAWISHVLDWDNEAYWTAEDGVYGAGRLKDLPGVGVGTELPENARVVFFPGSREPTMPAIQEKHGWITNYLH